MWVQLSCVGGGEAVKCEKKGVSQHPSGTAHRDGFVRIACHSSLASFSTLTLLQHTDLLGALALMLISLPALLPLPSLVSYLPSSCLATADATSPPVLSNIRNHPERVHILSLM